MLSVDQVWRSALKQYERDCGPDVVTDILKSKNPQDLLDYVEERRQKESRSKFQKLLSNVHTFGKRFEGYHSALDVIAQGVPFPGCLLWGSIRLVLGVSTLVFPSTS